MSNVCERHGVLKRSCEICYLEQDVKQLKNALEIIVATGGAGLFHKFSKEGHKKCVEVAEIVLDQI